MKMSLELRTAALEHLDAAEALCKQYPGTTRGFDTDIAQTRTMVADANFYTVVTSEEKKAILAAMATDFRGTGHWHTCENGKLHPPCAVLLSTDKVS